MSQTPHLAGLRLACALVLLSALPPAVSPLAAQQTTPAPAQAKAASPAPQATQSAAKSPETPAAKARAGNQAIIALINDEPITAYELEQRAAFIALSSGGGGDLKAKAEARWKQIIKDPKTNEKFQALLREKNVQTREQAQALQTKFVQDLQRNMVEQLKRESRAGALAGSKAKAQEELIEEKLKLQEAKKLSVVASEADVDLFIKNIAERNKMTPAQFAQHLRDMGVDIATMRSRFLAEISWREVIRRKFGHLVSINDRDVDKLVATAPGGEDAVELQLKRIVIATPPKMDQKAVAQRLSDANAVAQRFTDCGSIPGLAAQVQGAKFEDLGSRAPASIPEPTRTLLLNAKDGDMLPPSVGQSGIELWAVCGRKVLTANEQKRELAASELRQREFEILARKHLNDVRQDAAIEFR